MKRAFWILAAVLLFAIVPDVFGQRWKLRRYEMDIYLAGVSFHGDIGRANSPLANMFNGFRPSIGVKPRFFIQQNLAVSLDIGYLMYGGKDKEGESHYRLYSFNTQAFQHFARLEYYLLGNPRGRTGSIYNRRGMVNNYNRLYLYLYTGAGGILSKSHVKDLRRNGEEPLDNPGYDNSMKYSLAFPVGGGIKVSLNPSWAIGAEIGYQITLSDYLDGYSAAGLSEYNDSYYLTSFKIIYLIRNNRNNRPIFRTYYR